MKNVRYKSHCHVIFFYFNEYHDEIEPKKFKKDLSQLNAKHDYHLKENTFYLEQLI